MLMTPTGKHIPVDFESRVDVKKQEVLSNVSDDEVVAVADAIFLSYDELEQNGEKL
jgi:hypothetical protein